MSRILKRISLFSVFEKNFYQYENLAQLNFIEAPSELVRCRWVRLQKEFWRSNKGRGNSGNIVLAYDDFQKKGHFRSKMAFGHSLRMVQ